MEPGGQSSYHPERLVQYADIIAYVEEKHGAKIRGGYIACVKRMCGLEVSESRNKSKTGKPPKKPYCPANKVEYIKEALEHFGLLPQKS